MATHQYNNIGVAFKATIKEDGVAVDVSAASTKQLKFKRPDGSSFTKTATFVTDGTDGKIQYVTVDGDLNMAGAWTQQGYVAGVGGFTGHSTKRSFNVDSNIAG